MNAKWRLLLLMAVMSLFSMACLASFPYGLGGDENDPQQYPDRRYDSSDRLVQYAADLEEQADGIAEAISNQIYDRYESWSEAEVKAIYGSEKFLASCRVFHRLAERSSDDASQRYSTRSSSRSGLDGAFQYLVREFDDFEAVARRAGIRTYDLTKCADLIKRMEREIGNRRSFSQTTVERSELEHRDWEGKYAKGSGAAVYLIERQGRDLVRRPFKNLESLFKYNFDADRGGNPWSQVADVPAETLDRMKVGEEIERTFEGQMIIEPGTKENRPVYLIQGGKKRGLANSILILRYGGLKKVREVPKEIIDAYPEGEPIR
ncbi:MAG: hypothetical protein ACYDH3_07880 [Candidatus Aminicenantales bacterium]